MTQKISQKTVDDVCFEGKYKATTQENLYGFMNVVRDLLLLLCG